MNDIIVSEKPTGRLILPLNGVNGGPCTRNFSYNTSSFFTEANIPFARLHDIEYPLGGGHFVDIHCIFPNPAADETDPASYDFFYTDRYIEAIQATGCETFYRLGESIDWSPYRRYVVPPADFTKWARICERIVAHYNEGWNQGFHYNLRYWEIWNEPENPPMWTGTREQYFSLYRETSRLLRMKYPSLKIGGYASCGVYAAFNPEANDFYRGFITYAEEFLKFVREEELPLDFFSWHIYSSSPEEVLRHARYVREMLDRFGFEKCESILDEWNYSGPEMYERMRTMDGGSFTARTMCLLQKPSAGMTAAMYYHAMPGPTYGSIFQKNSVLPAKPYYAFKAFGLVRELENEIVVESDPEIECAAAAKDGRTAVLVCAGESERSMNVCFPRNGNISVSITDSTRNWDTWTAEMSQRISFHLEPKAFAFIHFTALSKKI